jgi:hypothetical protein
MAPRVGCRLNPEFAKAFHSYDYNDSGSRLRTLARKATFRLDGLGTQISPELTIGDARGRLRTERSLAQADQPAFRDAIEIAFAVPDQLDDVLRKDRAQPVRFNRHATGNEAIPCMIEGQGHDACHIST